MKRFFRIFDGPVLVFLAFIAFMGYFGKQISPAAPPEKKPAMLITATRPSIPALPTVLWYWQKNGEPYFDGKDLTARFTALVESHPEENVNTQLFGLLEAYARSHRRKESAVGIATVPFVAGPSNSMVASMTFPPGEVPSLNIDILRIARIDTAEDVMSAWLTLTHEMRHYEQWVESGGKQPPYVEDGGCIHHWRMESDAYTAECKLGKKWGYTDKPELCGAKDATEWRSLLYTYLMAGGGDRAEHCQQVWEFITAD